MFKKRIYIFKSNELASKKKITETTHTYICINCERACSLYMLMLIILMEKKEVKKTDAFKLTHQDKEENILRCTLIIFM